MEGNSLTESDHYPVTKVEDIQDEIEDFCKWIKTEREDPTEITGHQALVVVNLAPRKMFGEIYHSTRGILSIKDINIVLPRHVEAAILMTYCGLRTELGSKIGGKTSFFDPLK